MLLHNTVWKLGICDHLTDTYKKTKRQDKRLLLDDSNKTVRQSMASGGYLLTFINYKELHNTASVPSKQKHSVEQHESYAEKRRLFNLV